MLLKFKPLFNGTLGDWNLPPVSFELKKEGMKPYHGKAYPIPQIHKAILMKEIDQLCKIGVLWYHHYLQHPRHTHLKETKCTGKVCIPPSGQ